jgi:hypothetical protein
MVNSGMRCNACDAIKALEKKGDVAMESYTYLSLDERVLIGLYEFSTYETVRRPD